MRTTEKTRDAKFVLGEIEFRSTQLEFLSNFVSHVVSPVIVKCVMCSGIKQCNNQTSSICNSIVISTTLKTRKRTLKS